MSSLEGKGIRGLPGPLPAGESVLWQGAPDWWTIACAALHLRKVGAYFVVLLLWRALSLLADGHDALAAVQSSLSLVPLALAAMGLLGLLAWLVERTTTYTITDRRVVMTVGVALPITFNIPFAAIESASLRRYANGKGDIALVLSGTDRIAYLHLWPHARPWVFARPQPALRAVADASSVAATLSRAIAAAEGGSCARPVRDDAHGAAAGRASPAFAPRDLVDGVTS